MDGHVRGVDGGEVGEGADSGAGGDSGVRVLGRRGGNGRVVACCLSGRANGGGGLFGGFANGDGDGYDVPALLKARRNFGVKQVGGDRPELDREDGRETTQWVDYKIWGY